MRVTSLLTILGVMLAPPAFAAGNMIDPAEGRALAEKWCAECHLVTPSNRAVSAAPGAPPDFSAIGNAPGATELSLSVFLQTPHARMPDFQLSRDHIAILSRYIISLKSK